jgi:4-hydroxy-tetrahydrodipicolinate reductase
MMALVKKAAATLEGFDIEIIEKHHNQKLDAPSGTAIMLADAAKQGLDRQAELVYDRHSVRAKRGENEIGMHSVRGGNIVGEHEVIFAGHDEIVTVSHSARSREVFARGALSAALFMKGKGAGKYDMSAVIDSMIG